MSTFSSLYSQVIDSKQYNYVGNWYRWQGGSFITNLNLPKVTATTGRDTGAIRYALTDSSVYVWTGYQWRQIGGGGSGSQDLQSVTNIGQFTTNNVRTSASFLVRNSTNTVTLGLLTNNSNSNAELFLTNSASTISSRLRIDGLSFNNNGFTQYIKPYSAITADVDFSLPNTSVSRTIPISVNGVFANTSGDISVTTGEVNTGSNVGGGAEVFKQKTGVDFVHRTILGANGITVTQNTNDITISGNADSSAARVRTGTYTQRAAIVSPQIGDIFTQTDRLKGLYFYNGDSWDFNGASNKYAGFSSYEVANSGYSYNIQATGISSGAGATVSTTKFIGVGGVLNLNTGTTTTGYANSFIGPVMSTSDVNPSFDSVTYYIEHKVMLPVLSDGTDTYSILVGSTTSTGSIGFPAFGFKYTHGTNAGEFQSVTRAHNSGSLTTKDTNVPLVAGQWYRFAYELDGFAKTINFYIDDVLVTTHTTADNILYNGTITWGVQLGLGGIGIFKSAGTTARVMYTDYIFGYITKQKY